MPSKSRAAFLGALLGAILLAAALGRPAANAQGNPPLNYVYEVERRWEPAPPAGQFSYPYAVAVGTDGALYIADSGNNRIQVYAKGALLHMFGSFGSDPGQLWNPAGVAVNGSEVYVSDLGNDRIVVYSPAGDFIRTFGESGSGPGQLMEPGGLAVTPSGQVCVADRGNDCVACFDANSGAFLQNIGGPGNGEGQFANPVDVVYNAAAGEFCVVDQSNNRVQLFDTNWVFRGEFGVAGAANGQFRSPAGAGADASGRIYVADGSNNRVQVFGPAGDFLFKVGTPGAGPGQFGFPQDVAPGPGANPNFFVADTSNQRIQEFNSEHVFAHAFGSASQGGGQFAYPNGLGVGPNNTLIVADTNNARIQVGSYLFGTLPPSWETFGVPGAGNGQFNQPTGIAGAVDGRIYVVDSFNKRIQVLNWDGSFRLAFGNGGNGIGQFSSPSDVAVSLYSGETMGESKAVARLYVADAGNRRIQVFDIGGVFVSQWGSFGALDGQFSFPGGVAVAPDGNIYVTDVGNKRVQYFSPTGTFLGKWGSAGVGDGQFGAPSGIAIGADGLVYIADGPNARVQVFTPTGGFVTSFGSPGLDPGQFVYPLAVAVIGRYVFVADSSTGLISMFRRGYRVAVPLLLKQ